MSHPQFGFETTAEEVASTFAQQIKGKTILITGVSPNGLGFYTAKALAAHSPALLILAARSASTLDTAIAAIRETSSCATRPLLLDLSSIEAVRSSAQEVNKWTDVPQIDVLVNNAGIMSTPWGKTKDGIEQQFATNHIGHFLFTNLVMEKIIAAKGRVVSVSSGAHVFGPVRFDDYNFKDGADYDANKAYGQSKTANILFAVSLAEKLRGRGVTAFSLHPGVIFTNLMRYMSDDALRALGVKDKDGNLVTVTEGPMKMKTQSQGSATMIVAAVDPGIPNRSGAYLADCSVDPSTGAVEYALDKDNAERLWKLSEELVGQKFSY